MDKLGAIIQQFPLREFHCEACGRPIKVSAGNLAFEEHPECKEKLEAIRLEERARQAKEQRREHNEKRMENWRQRSRFPVDFARKTFQAFKSSAQNDKSVKIIQSWQIGDDFGFLLIGPSGSGKSHLAFSFLHQVAEQVLSRLDGYAPLPVYYPVAELLAEIKRNNFEIPERALSPTPLVLDDLGTENITEWSREILYRIFDQRLAHRFPTIVTTNLSIVELKERLHERIVSRILGLCIPLTITGRDHRRDEIAERYRQIAARAGIELNAKEVAV